MEDNNKEEVIYFAGSIDLELPKKGLKTWEDVENALAERNIQFNNLMVSDLDSDEVYHEPLNPQKRNPAKPINNIDTFFTVAQKAKSGSETVSRKEVLAKIKEITQAYPETLAHFNKDARHYTNRKTDDLVSDLKSLIQGEDSFQDEEAGDLFTDLIKILSNQGKVIKSLLDRVEVLEERIQSMEINTIQGLDHQLESIKTQIREHW
jgi:uncharacterized protein YdcH (DUF465 family)